MKTTILKSMMVVLMALSSLCVYAYDVKVNGIYYNLNKEEKTAEVKMGDEKYFGNVSIPVSITYNGDIYNVTSIGDDAFFYCTDLTSVNIPNSVTSIGSDAFENCIGLDFLAIPNSVTRIGVRAFRNCVNLTSLTIPNSVTEIGMEAFSYTGLTSVTIPNSVTTISEWAFGESGLTSITIPNSVKEIEWCAFAGCRGLSSVTIPDNVVSIGGGAFLECSGLTSVTIGNGVTKIDREAFQHCSNLTSVIIGSNVTTIGSRAFMGCGSLTSVEIPSSVTSIGGEAFRDCSGLTSITVPNSVTEISDWAFENCNGLNKVIVNDIDAWCGIAFQSKTSNPLVYAHHLYSDESTEVTNLVISNSVTSIGKYAFNSCSGLSSVTIPNSVTSIDDEAFYGCENLTDVYCLTEKTPSASENAFEKSHIQYATLHVPKNSIENYRNDAVWGYFGTIIPPTYKLTYMVGDQVCDSYELEEGAAITAEYEPQKKGYTFTALSEKPVMMPAHDVIVTGTFTPFVPVPSYKCYLSSRTTGVSSFKMGSYLVSKSVEFNLSNNGTKSIYVNKLIVKNPKDKYAVVLTNTDTSKLGLLAGGKSLNISINLSSDFEPCYEWHYIYKGNEFVFCSDINDPAYKYDVTFYIDDEIYVTYEYDYGDDIVPEAEPTKEGFIFSGWSKVPATMPNSNVRVTGSFAVDAIESVIADDSEYQIFTIDGAPIETLQKGVNIIKYKNGTSKKIVVK